jgi:small nuclear ribonucleoprotein (snRNP)-like protein
MNMVLGNVVERIQRIDQEPIEHQMEMLFVRGDGVILVSPI